MVRREPASVCTRKSRSKRFSRIALTGSALRRACRMIMIRTGRSAAGMMRRDHPVRALSADAALICEDPTWAHDGGRLRRDNLLDLSGNFFRGCPYATTVCRYFLV
jgi:D-arabinose 5-phosphate isomerase GutQ